MRSITLQLLQGNVSINSLISQLSSDAHEVTGNGQNRLGLYKTLFAMLCQRVVVQ